MTFPSTVFVPGTTITHEWLNAVNDVCVIGPDSNNVSYTPPFTGGVQTTVQDKLAQTVSVKDFGAVGDGVTDDTAAIQAAIAESVGKTIYFPAGIYAHTGIAYLFLNKCNLLGDSEYSSILKYVGPAGQDAVFFSGYAYSSIRRLGFDGNNLAKRGLVIHDDTGVTPGVTVLNYIENIRVTNCIDPTGCAISVVPTGDWQIAENTFRNIYGDKNYNGLVVGGSQTIMNLFDSVIFYDMQGGVGITVTDGRSNSFKNVHFAGETSIDWKFVSTPNGIEVDIDGFYREQDTGTVFKFENGATSNIGTFNINNVFITWSGTSDATKIIEQQFGVVMYKNFTISTYSNLTKGTLDFTHSNEAAGARNYLSFDNFIVSGNGASNIIKIYSNSYYTDISAGRILIRNSDLASTGRMALSMLRTTAFGTERNNSVAFFTGSNLDGRIGSVDGDTNSISFFANSGSELLRIGGTAVDGYQVKTVGSSGATGYGRPFYIGDYALWVDSAGKLRIKNGRPTSDTDGIIVGTQS